MHQRSDENRSFGAPSKLVRPVAATRGTFRGVMLFALLACQSEAEGEYAPATLESQSLLALQRFYEDDAGEQIETLIELLEPELVNQPGGFFFEALEPADVEMFEHSDEAIWAHTAGCGVLAEMKGDISLYAGSVPEADQSFADPSYAVWSRDIVGGTAEDFQAGGNLDTFNHIEKSGFGFAVSYDMDKDYRWHGDTLSMISLVPNGKFPEGLDAGLVVGFTIELWYLHEDTVIWYNASWTEIESALDEDNVDTEWWLQQLIDGTLDYYWGTEEHVTGEEH